MQRRLERAAPPSPLRLFAEAGEAEPSLNASAGPPPGLRFQPEFLSPADEADLVQWIASLPFEQFVFHGYLAKRRVVSFGYAYDFSTRKINLADPLPAVLLPIRQRAADFIGVHAERLIQATVIEYSPGAAIGWHVDRPQFEDVVGISLLSDVRLRFRRMDGGKRTRATVLARARSIYHMSGEARHGWEHSIPPVASLRYSIIFRTAAGNALR